MPSKELTSAVATFIRSISVSSENGGSFSEHECKEKAEELLSTILAEIAEPNEAMCEAGKTARRPGNSVYGNSRGTWRAMLAASALGEQSE